MKKLWFVRRRYGWGWTPATWQGWAILGAYTGGILSLTFRLNDNASPRESMINFFLPTLGLTILLFIITMLTGEKPKWQWGNDDKER